MESKNRILTFSNEAN